MITAVDTNILLDLLVPGAPHARPSAQALSRARRAGATLISEPVFAEIAGRFPTHEDVTGFLAEAGLRYSSSNATALHAAGRAWRDYARSRPPRLKCRECGSRLKGRCDNCGAAIAFRQHILADFIIGAHALVQADQLLTRDRGYYRTYYPDLTLA